MDEGDKLQDFFLKFILENSQGLEAIIEAKLDELWNIKQKSDEILIATGKTKGDDEGQVNIYVNIGEGDKRFVARIQDLIIEGGEDNSILCITKKFDKEDVEELMQNVTSSYSEKKNIKLIFVNIKNNEESEDMNFKDIIKEEVGIKVYRKNY